MSRRWIAIGDVHGCLPELEALLDRVAPVAGDRVVFLGDLVNRGPRSAAVVERAMELRATCILGNHEWRLLRYRRTGDARVLRPGDRRTLAELGEDHFRFLAAMKPHLHLRSSGIVFVHGGFLPGRPWRTQPLDVVTRIQVIDGSGRPQRRADCPHGRPWAEHWHGPPFVVYGHTPRLGVSRREWSLGIDTACVDGGWLTAWIHPEDRLVQVRSRRRRT